ncbi:MAG: hypothetical protein KDE33_24330, partial [Bacteroidetes bacterium]|nr:hypothetical protein [Bacteroidota bacterium]
MKIINITLSNILILISILICFTSCKKEESTSQNKNYKQEMRTFIQNISSYAKGIKPNFIIIPQNGAEIVSTTGDDEGFPEMDYINAIDGIGQE